MSLTTSAADGAAVAFALSSFLFAGLNDVVFKRYSLGGRSRGMLVMGIGVVWTGLNLLLLQARGDTLRFDAATVAFGAAAGTLLVASNVLLLESLVRVDLSLGSTIYRLNTVAVAVLAFVFLDERIGGAKAVGIAVGVTAVLVLSRRPGRRAAGGEETLVLAAVILASLLRAAYGVVTRGAMLAQVPVVPLLLIVSTSWILGGALYALARERRLSMTREKAAYAAVSGTFVFLVVYFLTRAVEHGEASVVIPIANMSFVVALAVSIASGMERLTIRKTVAVGLAAGAIVLLAGA
jgi:drug/metabolite transporter (DMT)-like permease